MPNWLTDPLTKLPSRMAKGLADKIDPPMGEGGRMRGFLAGALTGAGDVASDMTSPLSLASSALGGGGLTRLRKLKGLIPSAKAPIAQAPETAKSIIHGIERTAELGPEFTPVGGENLYNKFRQATAPKGPSIQQISDEGSRLTSKGMPIGGNDVDVAAMMAKRAQSQPKAVFKGIQEGAPEAGIADIELYDIDWPDHPLHQSTVSIGTARKLGLIR